MRFHGADFSPESRYLVYVGLSGLPVALSRLSCFPSSVSHFLFNFGIFLFGIIGVVRSPASAYTPFGLLLPGWAAIFGVCDSPRAVSHGWMDNVF